MSEKDSSQQNSVFGGGSDDDKIVPTETADPKLVKTIKDEAITKNKQQDDANKNKALAKDLVNEINEDDDSITGKKDPNQANKKSTKGKYFIYAMLVMTVLFAIWAIPYYFMGGSKKQELNVKKAQVQKIQDKAKSDPKFAQQLTQAQANNPKSGLDVYNSINAQNTQIMLQVHDAIAKAMKDKDATAFKSRLNNAQNLVNKNSQNLAKAPKDGDFSNLNEVSQNRLNNISQMLSTLNSENALDQIENTFNSTAQKENDANNQFLTAFKQVLDKNNISYTTDGNGNFKY